ncbi:hypothetical protein ABT297_18295 [Dactylosporangium sp. NPDC000555]|uniref:hypothetical protein n=1 Tax=Dactylosporangium sp. NPDC000555 TaxID=3154260 RepID=UPI00331C4A55
MLAGDDENPQLSDVAEHGRRHLRSRRGRHAAYLRNLVPEPERLLASGPVRVLASGSARVLASGPARALAAGSARVLASGPARTLAAGSARAYAAGRTRLLASGPGRFAAAMPAGARRTAVAATIVAVAAFGLAPALTSSDPPAASGVSLNAQEEAGAAQAEAPRDDERAGRSSGRSKGTDPKAGDPKAAPKAADPKATGQGSTGKKATGQGGTPPAAAPSPTRLAPVGGLSQAEMDNAVAIVDVAKRENLPKRAVVVALATALQESHLRNLANPNLPQSLHQPNEGVGYDYDSVGLFQQRPNWGTVEELMNPHESARRFYAALLAIPGWGDYAVTVAAQMVQRSAFPNAYAKWEGLATRIADATM